jgi:hypothetical protein
MADAVNHPEHYNQEGIECIDVVEAFGFNLGNAIKYVWRRNKKGNPLQDLEKATWYLNRAERDLVDRRGEDFQQRAIAALFHVKDPLTRAFIFELSADPNPEPEFRRNHISGASGVLFAAKEKLRTETK